jgi:hypothetical protein
VPVGRLVVGRGDDLALDRAPEVRGLLGALVDEQHDEVHVGVGQADAVGDLLEQDRLARARRGRDQAALAHADGRDQVEHAHVVGGTVVALDGLAALEHEALGGIDRGQLLEERQHRGLVGGQAVDGLHVHDGEAAAQALGPTIDLAARAQVRRASQRDGQVGIGVLGDVAGGDAPQPALAVGSQLEHAGDPDALLRAEGDVVAARRPGLPGLSAPRAWRASMATAASAAAPATSAALLDLLLVHHL